MEFAHQIWEAYVKQAKTNICMNIYAKKRTSIISINGIDVSGGIKSFMFKHPPVTRNLDLGPENLCPTASIDVL